MQICCTFEKQLINKLVELGIKFFNITYPELKEINYLDYDYRWENFTDKFTFVKKPFNTSKTIFLRTTPEAKNSVEEIFIIMPFLLKFFIEETRFKKKPITSLIDRYIFKGNYIKERYGDLFSFYRQLGKAYESVEFYVNSDSNTKHELKSILNLKYANLFSLALDIYPYTK